MGIGSRTVGDREQGWRATRRSELVARTGVEKVLVVELMKEERGEWEGGLVVVGPKEEGEGWEGMDEWSAAGIALERLGMGKREEGEEVLL